jgi:hypothetical protein
MAAVDEPDLADKLPPHIAEKLDALRQSGEGQVDALRALSSQMDAIIAGAQAAKAVLASLMKREPAQGEWTCSNCGGKESFTYQTMGDEGQMRQCMTCDTAVPA